MSLLDHLRRYQPDGRRFIEDHRAEILEALQAGFSARAIYRALRQDGREPPIGERQFQRLVARWLAPSATAQPPRPPPVAPAPAPRVGIQTQRPEPQQPRKFQWDPTAGGDDIT